MKQSIPDFFRNLFNKESNDLVAGISIHQDSVRLVKLQKAEQGFACQTAIEMPLASEEQLPQALARLIAENQLESASVAVVLPSARIQSSQMESDEIPQVDPQAALRWQLKDLISIPGPDMVCDFIDMPLQPMGQKPKAQIFATSRGYLNKILAPFHEKSIEISCVSAEQLALAQLQDTKDAAQLAYIQHESSEGILLILKNRQICFARKLRGSDSIVKMSPEQLQAGGSDNIAIEIQRSIDYYESQLKQPPIKNVFVALDGNNEELLIQALNLALPVKTKSFIVDNVANGEMISHKYLATLGMALTAARGAEVEQKSETA